MNSLTSFYYAMSDISRDAADVARSPTPSTTDKMRHSLERAIETVNALNRDARRAQSPSNPNGDEH